jgi:hypothetical protein
LLRFSGKLIAGDMNRFDLRFRRQLLPFETVDTKDGTGAGDVVQLALPFGRVIGERVEQVVRDGQAERRSRRS